jgi:hypothetical protein
MVGVLGAGAVAETNGEATQDPRRPGVCVRGVVLFGTNTCSSQRKRPLRAVSGGGAQGQVAIAVPVTGSPR